MSPASGSETETLPTTVPRALFSAIDVVKPVTAGASFTSVRFTVTVAVPASPVPPWSVTVTSSVKVCPGTVSKSSAAGFATVIWPDASIAKAPAVFPFVSA